MSNRLVATLTSGVLFALAAFVSLSVTLAFAAPVSQNLLVIVFRGPGRFLVESFHIASLYVPLVLSVAAALLLADRITRKSLLFLLASVVPFFTIATAVRLIAGVALESSPLLRSLVASLGVAGSLSAAVLLSFIEVALLVLIWYRTRSVEYVREVRHESVSMTSGMRRIHALLESPKTRAPRSLVDLPDPDIDSEPVFHSEPGIDAVPQEARPVDPAEVAEAVDLDAPPVVEVADAEPVGPADDRESEEPLVVAFSRGRFIDEWDPRDERRDARFERVLQVGPDDAVDADESDEFDEPEGDDARVEVVPDRIVAGEVNEPTEFAAIDEADDDEDEDDEEDDEDPEVEEEVDAAVAGPAGDFDAPVVPEPRSVRYDVPIDGLLHEYADKQYWMIDEKTREAAEILRVTLDEFGIQAEVTGIRKGPVITMFEILPAKGVKLSKIVNLSDNIALRLAASSVRIVAPIPGKHAVGIEIPNRERAIVGFAELLQEESFQAPKAEIPIALGKDIPGDAQIVDLTRMPHVLIAGATGSGKSVCVNSIICSILYRRAPHEVKLILIDPKIVELKFYNDIPHLLTPVITDPKRAFQALQYCIYEMERRYTLLDALQVRDIQSYNRKIKTKRLATEPLPYIVVVVDEFADLMATSGKELESTLARLAAMSRAVGIHLVLATQRPSTDVITGLIKANIPSRIAFMVASKVDSRIILDAMGADKLLGRGDMLFTSAWDPFPVRMQGAFLSEDEVERVVTYVKQLGEPDYIDDEIFVEEDDEDYVQGELEDPLMEKAIEIVQTAGKASASYLQRRLKVGYNRAARMVEEMERLGIVGPQQGSKPRDVIGTADRY